MSWSRVPRSRRASLFVLLLAASPLLGAADEPVLEDPVAIRRVLLPAERVAAELKRAGEGVLVSLPRDKFEALVQEATRSGKRQRRPPALLKAVYKAFLQGDALEGSGGWTILNPADSGAVFPLPDLNLALSKVKTEADYKDAVIGDLDGARHGILVKHRGAQKIDFDWSLRGVPAPGGLRFELRVPACAAAGLELRLPPEQIVVPPADGILLSGPHDSETPRLRLWQLYFSGRSRLEFVVRSRSPAGAAPLLLATIQSRQSLKPGRCQAVFDFQLDAVHDAVDELGFDCDPGLEPYSVECVSGLKGWEVQETAGAAPGAKLLRIKLREPVQGMIGTVKVRCLALVALDGAWSSPALRPRQAFVRGETLELKVGPEIRLEKWEAGRFRLLRAKAEPDGVQVIHAITSGAGAGPRPNALLRTRAPEMLVRQETRWQIGPREMTLTTDATLEARGALLQLAFRLPVERDWQLETVTLDGKDLSGKWQRAGRMLFIDVDRAPETGMKTGASKLTIGLRAGLGKRSSAQPVILDFPDFTITSPCTHTGTLAIAVDSIYDASVLQSSTPTMASAQAGLKERGLPDYLFAWGGQPVTGKLRLARRKPGVTARCVTEIVMAPTSAAVRVKLDLRPAAGQARAVILYTSSPPQGRWSWKADDGTILNMEALPALDAAAHLLYVGMSDPLAVLAIRAALPAGQRWRLDLGGPLRSARSFVCETTIEDLPNSVGWEVPLVSVLDAERMEGQVSFQSAVSDLGRTIASGLAEGEYLAGKEPHWRTFRYAQEASYPRLILAARPAPAGARAAEVCDRAELTSYVEPGGRLVHHFRFQVRNWREQRVNVFLAGKETQVLGATVDSRGIGLLAPQRTPEGVQVRLPVPADGRVHRFEVVYASAMPDLSWPPWGKLVSPAPQLPVAPACFRRTWRIPPGLVPLDQSALYSRTLPRSSRTGRIVEPLRRAWQSADPLLGGMRFTKDWAGIQREQVLTAEAARRRRSGQDKLLGTALEGLACELPDKAVILDTLALAEAGLRPATKLMPSRKAAAGEPVSPFWEGMGLIHVPSASGVVFTSQREWNSRQAFAEEFAAALADAASYGEDAAGRFQTLDVWFRSRHHDQRPSQYAALGENFSDWTQWESFPGTDDDALIVVNSRSLTLVGMSLALVLCAFACWVGKSLSQRWNFRLLLIWLGLAGMGLLWSPAGLRPASAPVFLAAVAVSLLWYVRAVIGRTAQVKSRQSSLNVLRQSAAAMGLLVALTGWVTPLAFCDDPTDTTVYLIADPSAGPSKQLALVPPALLKTLDDLARRDVAPVQKPVLVAARYQGSVKSASVDFRATFDFYSPNDQGSLSIPLEGVDLTEEAFLDGKPVEPVAGAQTGYVVRFGGQGEKNGTGFHRLELGFRTRINAAATAREFRFLVPRLAQSQVEVLLPPGCHGIQAKTDSGRLKLERVQKGEQRLQLDLGRAGAVHLRWRQGQAANPAPTLRVRELYMWDLRPPAPGLNALLQYSVDGQVSRLALLLPRQLELQSADIALPGETLATNTAHVKRWHLEESKGRRLLHIELLQPLSGEFLLKLVLVPRLSIAPGNVVLSVPLPLDIKPEGFGTGFLAYRLQGLEARESPQNLAVVVVSTDLFGKAWRTLDSRSTPEPTRAFSFSRNAPDAALNLGLAAPSPVASQAIRWHVQPGHAEMTASCELESAAEDLSLLEWQVPSAITVTGVSGQHVHSWSRHDALLQVWLSQPQKDATVTISGWMKNAEPLLAAGRFELPTVSIRQPPATTTTVQVAPASGIALEPLRVHQLTRSPGRELGGAFIFATQASGSVSYNGSFRLKHLPVKPLVELLTTTRIEKQALAFTSYVECQVPFGELRELTVEVRRWPGQDVKLRASGIKPQVREEMIQDGHRLVLALPPGIRRTFSLQLSGTRPLHAGEVVLPDVRVTGAASMQRWLALTGSSVQPEPGAGIQKSGKVLRDLTRWPDEAQRLSRVGSLWQITRDDWDLKVRPQAGSDVPAVKLLVSEQQAVPSQSGHWVHQALFLFYAQGETDLHCTLPKGARLLTATLDSLVLSPRLGEGGEWPLPLVAPGRHVLRLRWTYKDPEPLRQPNLAPPLLRGVSQFPIFGMLRVPVGHEAASAVDAVEMVFHRAAAHVELSRLLAEQSAGAATATSSPAILKEQQMFLWQARELERLAGKSAVPAIWLEKLKTLRRQNADWANRLGYGKCKSEAEEKPALPEADDDAELFALPANGRPIYWRQDNATPKRLVLGSPAVKHNEHLLLASEVLLLLLFTLSLISWLPHVGGFVVALWPEQLFVLAWIGWWFFGGSVLGILLITAGVSARLILAAFWVRRLLTPMPRPRAGSSYVPGA